MLSPAPRSTGPPDWLKKGDTASLLSQTAGGQAIALLCFCLKNIYILSVNQSLASIEQLAQAASIVSSKVLTRGFGNILARHVFRIHDAYKLMGKAMQCGFFDRITRESVVDYFHALSKVFCEENQVVRVSGTQAMAHMVTIAMIMFPNDVLMPVDEVIIHQGQRRSIILELDSNREGCGPSVIQVEQALSRCSLAPMPISVQQRTEREPSPFSNYVFEWSGQVANALQNCFLNVGLVCPDAFYVALCDYILQATSFGQALGPNQMADYVGLDCLVRVREVCRIVLRSMPSCTSHDISSASHNLAQTFLNALGDKVECTCSGKDTECDVYSGWESGPHMAGPSGTKYCIQGALWRDVWFSVEHVMNCLLVDAETNATIPFSGFMTKRHSSGFIDLVNEAFDPRPCKPEDIYSRVMNFGGMDSTQRVALAREVGSSTIYPATLLSLRLEPKTGSRYCLRDGQLLVKDRYYQRLDSRNANGRSKAPSRSARKYHLIVPSRDGEHSRVDFSVQESLRTLLLRTTVEVRGQTLQLDLGRCILSSMLVKDAQACDHWLKGALDPELNVAVLATSVAAPIAKRCDTIAIVLTKGNPEA